MVSKGANVPEVVSGNLKHNKTKIFLTDDLFKNDDGNSDVKTSKICGENACNLEVTAEATENSISDAVTRNSKIHDVATRSEKEMVKSLIGDETTNGVESFKNALDSSEEVNNKDVSDVLLKDFIPKSESRNCHELPIISVIERNLKVCLPIPKADSNTVLESSNVPNQQNDEKGSVSDTLPKSVTKDNGVAVFTIPDEHLRCRKSSDSDGTHTIQKDSTETTSCRLLNEMNSSDSSKVENMVSPINQNTAVTTSGTRNWREIIKEPFTTILNFSKFKRFFKKKELKAKLKTSASLTSSNSSFSIESQVSSQTVPEENAEKFWSLLDEWRSKTKEANVNSSDMVEKWLSKDLREFIQSSWKESVTDKKKSEKS